MKANDLVIGTVYFMTLYPTPKLDWPVIISYRYFGTNANDSPPPSEAGYFFEHEMGIIESDPPIEKECIFLTEQQLEGIHDLSSLITELELAKSGELARIIGTVR